jgi:hypothetical protein
VSTVTRHTTRRSAHDERIARKQLQDALGRASNQRLDQGTATPSAHYDKIGASVVHVVPDEVRWQADLNKFDEPLPCFLGKHE